MKLEFFRAHKKKLMTGMTLLFVAVVGFLLYGSLSEVEWGDVWSAVDRVPLKSLLSAAPLALLGYLLYAHFDYLGFRHLRVRRLPYRRVIPTALVTYAFNLNLGALVGSVGFRFRLYTGWGSDKKDVSLITLFSTLTSWSGYVLLLSGVLAFRAELLEDWIPLPPPAIAAIGYAGLVLVITYLALSFRRFRFRLKDHDFQFPALRVALTQFLLSCCQWLVPGSIIFTFLRALGADVSFEQVLFAHFISAIAGVITHIPGGLGVLETVFLRMGFGAPKSDILVALLCFRVVYYLGPLATALPAYLILEWRQRGQRGREKKSAESCATPKAA